MFATGSFPPDRATRIENALADITAQIDDISLTIRDREARFCSIEDRLTALERRGYQDRDCYDDRDRSDFMEQEDYHGYYPLRDSDGGGHPGQHGDPMQDRRHSHGLPKKRKDCKSTDGEYRAMNTGNKYKGSDNCQYQTASSKMRSGKDTRSSRK